MKKLISVGLLLVIVMFLILGCSAVKGSAGEISRYSFFPDLDDEYKISSYFMNSQEKKIYTQLDKEQRINFLFSFWLDKDPNPVTPNNEQVEAIKIRIQYANQNFSHFQQGWESDRGRIFIKYGMPFEMRSENTGQGVTADKHANKDYEIWKYRLDEVRTYIFFDIHRHGEFNMIYSNGDNGEQPLSNWREYLGSGFDPGELY